MQFYMIRMDKVKAKDSYIVKSWVVNKLNDEKTTNTRNVNGNVDMSNVSSKYRVPIYSTRNDAARKERKFIAMMMLGGIRKKSN